MRTTELLDFSPPYLHPEYEISVQRAPQQRLVELPKGWFHHAPGPAFGRIPIRPGENDLTAHGTGQPIGQRIVVHGRLLDSDRRPVPNALIEIWQTNAAGRYLDAADPGFMPVDPNFTGAGRCLTDSEGRYRFTTVKPAAYSAGRGVLFRPAHIHVSIFGPGLSSRLVTQLYFPDEPLNATDPILQSIPDPRGIQRLIAQFAEARLEEDGSLSALWFDWDIVLRGPHATPMEA